MPRDITVTFDDGSTHVYQNAPDDITPADVTQRAAKEFNKTVTALDGGRKGTSTGIKPELGDLSGMPDMTRRTFRAPSALALHDIYNKSGGVGEYWTQAIKAFGRGGVKSAGALGDVSGGALGGTTEDVVKALDLKETPARFYQYEVLGSVLGPQVVGTVMGGAARVGAGAVNKLQTYFSPKLANYLAAAEGKGSEILNWLTNAKEIVPGSAPTVTQAIADAPNGGAQFTRFASLQPRNISNIPEEARTAYNLRRAEQEAARETTVGQVAGTPVSLQMAEGQRLAKSEPLYETARSPANAVDVSPIEKTINDIVTASPRHRDLTGKVESVRENLIGVTNGQEAVSALDDLKSMIKSEKDTFVRGELTKIKDSFIKTIPGLENAELTFRTESGPINTMNIGSYLKDALTGSLPAGTERAGAYAGALKNAPATIKKSTGQARFTTLEDAGVPKADIAKLNAVAEDLNRSLAAEKLQSAGGGLIPKDPVAYQLEILNRTATFMNKIVSTVAQYVGHKKAVQIAFEMLDPQAAAKVLEQAMAMEQAQTARSAAAAIVGPATRTIGATISGVNALAPPSQNSLANQTGQ